MSDIDRKRDYVTGLYPGNRWRVKVAKMPDAQVLAIYFREINKAKERKPAPPKNVTKESTVDDLPF